MELDSLGDEFIPAITLEAFRNQQRLDHERLKSSNEVTDTSDVLVEKPTIISTIGRAVGKENMKLEELAEVGNCLGVNSEMFFPERGASTKEAKAVCAGCIVQTECLEFALANGEKFGIWGGVSERERRRIRKQRALDRQAVAD